MHYIELDGSCLPTEQRKYLGKQNSDRFRITIKLIEEALEQKSDMFFRHISRGRGQNEKCITHYGSGIVTKTQTFPHSAYEKSTKFSIELADPVEHVC